MRGSTYRQSGAKGTRANRFLTLARRSGYGRDEKGETKYTALFLLYACVLLSISRSSVIIVPYQIPISFIYASAVKVLIVPQDQRFLAGFMLSRTYVAEMGPWNQVHSPAQAKFLSSPQYLNRPCGGVLYQMDTR
jgi:hypothetical protein